MGSVPQDKTERLVEVLNKAAQDHPVSPGRWSEFFTVGGLSVYTFVDFDWVKAHGQMVITVQLLVAQGVGAQRQRVICLLRDENDLFFERIGRFDSGEAEFRVPAGTYHLEFYCRPRNLVAA